MKIVQLQFMKFIGNKKISRNTGLIFLKKSQVGGYKKKLHLYTQRNEIEDKMMKEMLKTK